MIDINTYLKLRKVLQEFKKGTFDFLIIIGSAGLGKTYNTRKILGKKVCYINSSATSLGLYLSGFENRDIPMWFDDVESLFEKDKMIGLLKQFCETTEIKNIQYNTSWDMEESKNVPKSYETKSKVLMTSNSLTRLQNKGVQSLLDRAIIINFKPSKQEITTYINKNFKKIYDKSILDSLQIDENFSLRDYIKKVQLKKAGLI
ncbi:MAG TPA: hypothetical protein VI911_04950 [Patescibacteria group bacterium]|nr:hypothetical protein [Patescibacteria group bacterium]